MRTKFKYTFGNHSDVGKKRKINQDSFATAKNDWGEIFIVADGMGGHKGGEVASKITADYMCNEFKLANSDISPAVFLDRSIQSANDVVSSKAKEETEFEGMGTTVVAVIIQDEEAHIAHVGDSRVYIFRNGRPFFMTKDHSFVQDLVDQGLISEEEAEDHPKKNRILQAIGTGPVKPDITTKRLYKGDRILMCSDGLSGEVKEPELIKETSLSEPMKACKALVDLANERGGPDNITVIAVHIDNGDKPPKFTSSSQKKGIRLELILIILFLLCMRIVIYNKYTEEEEPTLDIKISSPKSEDISEDEEATAEEKSISDEEEEEPSEKTDQQGDSLRSIKDDQAKNDDKEKKVLILDPDEELVKSEADGQKSTLKKEKKRSDKKDKKINAKGSK